ncbi:MAG: FhaA domain-containing protein [Chloroflexota bacterium]
MNVFQRLERALQRSVERPFTRLAGSRLQPVEIARALAKELVINRRVGVGRVYAPNWFRAQLSEADFRQCEPFLLQLQREIAQDLIRQAQRRKYEFVGAVSVELLADANLRRGDILASAEIRGDEPAQQSGALEEAPLARTSVFPVVRPADSVASVPASSAISLTIRDDRGVEQRLQMVGEELKFGRGLENDVVLDSLSVSREHARLLRADGLFIEDLGSRNGTFVNGQRIQRARVGPGDRIRLGATELRIDP